MRMRLTPASSFLCLVSAGCATMGPAADATSTLSLTRPDGVIAVCTRPPAPWLDSTDGVGVAGAVPDIIQHLVSSPAKSPTTDEAGAKSVAPQGDLMDAVVRSAPTARALDVLDYRICLEYGKGIVSRDAYVHWLLDVRPLAFKAVGGARGGS